ncbi:MAG TPA: AraC family transcriptional regulator [Firmicutes bacterium]|jgi:AraC-like DNA-binding protein|nr:AraC family transcriptional regulator [Bacillota bacterium]
MNNEILENKMKECQKDLILLLNRLINTDGIHSTAIPALDIIRASDISEPLPVIYEPSLLVIVQGAKMVTLSNDSYMYDPTSYLVTSVHLPVSSRIIQANSQEPYLCIQLGFSINQIIDIVAESNLYLHEGKDSKRSLVIKKTNYDLFDAILRLVRLLETGEDIKVISPLIIREILYRVLKEDQGAVTQFAMIDNHANRISKVIGWINEEFAKPMKIENLADKVNMSTSALYNQFKKVTSMSPLQYQKLIRLQEARRLLLAEKSEAASVCFQVGYESPSQFSREYARLFGLPPISDMKRLRSSTGINPYNKGQI